MRNNLPLNPIQALLAVVKIAALLLLPVIAFGYLGFMLPFGFSGFRLMMAGNVLMYIPLILYLLMLMASFGAMRRYSIICGVLALVCEIVFMCIAGTLLQQGDMASLIDIVMKAIPTDNVLGVEITKDFIVYTFAKPGLALIINVVGSVLYIGSHFLMGFVGGGMNNGFQNGTGSQMPQQQKNGTRSSGNRNNPVL